MECFGYTRKWQRQKSKNLKQRNEGESMKRVFILGAGSSIGHSEGMFPRINTFFKVAKNKELEINLADEHKAVVDYIRNTTGKDVLTKADNVDIEVIFTLLEIEIERNPSPELFSIREQLLTLIQKVLLGLGNKVKPDEGEYNTLKNTVNEKEDTIINFNWDLLLDDIFNRKDILQRPYYYTNVSDEFGYYRNFIYGFSALQAFEKPYTTIMLPYKDWHPKKGFYLKMHGSIDWYYCPNDQCRASLKVFPILAPNEKHYCSDCHESLKCLIIPPVLNKSYRQYPIIRRIWNVAAKVMSVTEELVIWGYSLPPTDFYASWLIRQARQAPLKYVHIINPSVISERKNSINSDFVSRFRGLFREKSNLPTFCLYENYSDFEKNIEITSKHHLLGNRSLFVKD